MIFKTGRNRGPVYCDTGPNDGEWRLDGFMYVTDSEVPLTHHGPIYLEVAGVEPLSGDLLEHTHGQDPCWCHRVHTDLQAGSLNFAERRGAAFR